MSRVWRCNLPTRGPLLPHQHTLSQLLCSSSSVSHVHIKISNFLIVAATTWQNNLLPLLSPMSLLPNHLLIFLYTPIPMTTPASVTFTIYVHVTDFSQAAKVAKASAKVAPSVTARFSVTTFKASPSPPSAVSHVVVVSSVSLPVCSSPSPHRCPARSSQRCRARC